MNKEIQHIVNENLDEKIKDIKDIIEFYDDNYNYYRRMYLQTQSDDDKYQMNKWLKLRKEQENLLKDMKETSPEYYLKHYKDDDTFSSINISTKEKTNYSGKEYKELFMFWYDKILPFLENKDENGALETLLDWNEETLAKFDMYSLVRKFFKQQN